MEDYGLIINKHAHATEGELISAVTKGKMLIVNMATDLIWRNNHFKDAGHIIVITGAERSRETGQILAFYVNDSDNGAYFSGGRLVPYGTFMEAWKEVGSQFYEVQ